MLTRRAWLAAACAVGCSAPNQVAVLDWPQLRDEFSARPGLLYFWALWSRPSVELLSTIAEFAGEYDDLPVFAVCLDDDPAQAAARVEPIAKSLPLWLDHYVAPLDFERLLADFAVSAPPAALVRDDSRPAPVVLEGDALTPDRLDAFVAQAAAIMTTTLLGR